MASKEAGLPNIQGSIEAVTGTMHGNGVFYDGYTGSVIQSGLGGTTPRQVIFNASRSAEIYGKSDTLQPAALWLISQVKF
ncbi:hypothetical protein QUV93_01560 [Phascolarctobacterium faecium]|nr:hypothetical protein [Phascolarctobacterium faecium]MDM8108555.1 hypothetical protein [Phascolarctobacterium faecium]